MRNGKSVDVRIMNPYVSKVNPVHIEAKPIVILEGTFALHWEHIRRLTDISVYVACSPETRLRRRIVRDISAHGKSEEVTRRQFETQVQPLHERFVEPCRRFANIQISWDGDAENSNFAGLLTLESLFGRLAQRK